MSIETATELAATIGQAIVKGLAKRGQTFTAHIRPHLGADINFIEIALRKPGGTEKDEIAAAYSQAYYDGITKENLQVKAKRIYTDLELLIKRGNAWNATAEQKTKTES